MRTLSLLILFAISVTTIVAQSPHGSNFNRDCKDCHSLEGWSVIPSQIVFKHAETGFDLVGQHKSVQCRACHTTLVFSEAKAKTNCSSCHTDIHENTVGKNCVRCHDPRTWIIEKVSDVHRMSRFPLVGNHAKADCNQCHKSASNLRFDPIGINCFDCHMQTYFATKNPDHAKSNFSTDCQQCHKINSPVWAASSIIHDFFPLTGGHNISNCFSCHQQGSYKGLSQECYSCHQKHYEGVTSPNHMMMNFPKDCKQCHSVSAGAWKPATYANHDQFYPLLGAHNLIRNDCSKCHSTGYNQTARQCVSCHQKNYDGAVNPNHKGAGFSTDCASCHTSTAWKPSTYDHDGRSFPINSGAHRGKWNLCSDCHVDPTNYKSFECTNCHEHAKANTDSEHANVNGYAYQSRACYACHPVGSKQGGINHSLTNFPLLGSHANVACSQCHQNGFAGTSTDCVSCHLAKYTAAPNHAAQGYPQDCKQCHTSTIWKQISFNHSTTKFALTGAHITVVCSSCHTTKLAGTSQECSSCHQAKFASAPNHVAQNYPQTCAQCHTTTAWNVVSFNHTTTKFPLTGSHITVKCSSCHTSGFAGTSTDCFVCHQAKYNTAKDHATLGYPQNCVQCHSTIAWTDVKFNHAVTKFPLTGTHLTVKCNLCHSSGFAGTPTNCYACHQAKFASAPNHAAQNYPQTCEQCHKTTDWKDVSFNHANTKFPLVGSHVTVKCSSCHTTVFAGTPTNCYACHQAKFASAPNHAAQNYPQDCTKCHTPVTWTDIKFDHATTKFQLTGTHLTVKCGLCHTSGLAGTPTNCYACHQAKFASAPNHVSQGYPQTCEQCHKTTDWKDVSFNHANTKFPLTGTHTTVKCSSCHTSGFAGTPTNCYACHQAKFASAPNHVSQGYPQTCEQCHKTTDWKDVSFNHANTKFPLVGNHVTVKCSSCHTTVFAGTPTNCYACHQAKYNSATNHASQNYPQDCTKCHAPTVWTDIKFDHTTTKFQLTGTHLTVKCGLCHTSGLAGTPTNCYACHQAKFASAPNHVSQGYPQTCEQCHKTTDWKDVSFNHANTKFPLVGSHVTVKCSSCHTTVFAGTPTNCYACHQAKYSSAPNHASQNYPQDCTKCHAPTVWTDIKFDHTTTKFQLTGTHLTVKCGLCHTSGLGGTPTNCYACHQAKFASAPNHVSQGYPQTCERCHNTTDWKAVTFNHATTKFPLTGAHVNTQCNLCHTTVFTGTPTNCYACHQAKYNSAPNHVAQGYPQTCEQCHSTTAWQGATFNHSTTAFPLTGGHISVTCSKCHTTTFKGTPTVCSSCHLTKYQSTTNPNHVKINIPTTCEQCHTTTPGWKPATFPIHNNYYQLLGAHLSVACATCHNGNYATPPPNTCVGCHLTNYNNSRNPNHATAQFPKTCESCHSQNVWSPSTFNHDGQYFPIYSGEHRGKWSLCSDCHTDQTNFKVFTCFKCHPQAQMDSKHAGVRNYVSTPVACYNCHPTGKSGN